MFVAHGFSQKRQDAIKTFIGLVYQHVTRLQLLKDRGVDLELLRETGVIRREQPFGSIDQINQLVQSHQVHGAMHTVERRQRQFKLVQQEV